jgi:hypothetical protein
MASALFSLINWATLFYSELQQGLLALLRFLGKKKVYLNTVQVIINFQVLFASRNNFQIFK